MKKKKIELKRIFGRNRIWGCSNCGNYISVAPNTKKCPICRTSIR